jgi:hypothetical protein
VWITAPTLEVDLPLASEAKVKLNVGYVLALGMPAITVVYAWIMGTLVTMRRYQTALRVGDLADVCRSKWTRPGEKPDDKDARCVLDEFPRFVLPLNSWINLLSLLATATWRKRPRFVLGCRDGLDAVCDEHRGPSRPHSGSDFTQLKKL